MGDLYSFYNSILNISGKDIREDILKIVLEERKKLSDSTNMLDGFCKYLASQIEYRIKKEVDGIHTYKIDLKELVNVDHTILVAEYMVNSKLVRLLIDPSFLQFTRKDNSYLVNLKHWPSDKIKRENFAQELTTNGMVELDNESFLEYLNAFLEDGIDFDLDNYLMEEKISKLR